MKLLITTFTLFIFSLSGQVPGPSGLTRDTSTGTTTYSYSLGPNDCDYAWVTSVYYDFGRHDTLLRVGGWGDWYYSLLRCPFTGLPGGAASAKLFLYKFQESGSQSAIYLDRVTGSWGNNVKWPTQPAASTITALPAPEEGHWYEIDITNLFNGWKSGAFPNQGVMLRPTSNSDVYDTFWSPGYAEPDFRPRLVVTYPPPITLREPPRIQLLGPTSMSVPFGSTFLDPGYTAMDAVDGDITAKVLVSGQVNTYVAGTYRLSYNVVDSAGLAAETRIRTVTVSDAPGMTTTTYQLTPDECSFVWVTSVYYGFGRHDDDLRTGGWGDYYYSLLKCSTPGPRSPAVRATLRLYPAPNNAPHGPMYLDRVTGAWNNSTRWQNRPSAVNIATLPTPTDNQWYEIDVTGLYNDGSFASTGIQLRTVSNNDVFDTFLSPLYSDTNFVPQLIVTRASNVN